MTRSYRCCGFNFNSSCDKHHGQNHGFISTTLAQVGLCLLITRSKLLTVLIGFVATTVLVSIHRLQSYDFVHRRPPCCKQNATNAYVFGLSHVIENDSDISGNISLSRVKRIASEVHNNFTQGWPVQIGLEVHRGRMKRRLPQCLIIGVRKGGTRALLEFLNLHPSILAGKQEMHFFDDDRNYALGLQWYRKKMRYSFPEQITVEKTPAYFVDARVPARVHRMNRTIKLLLTVRDPIERAISDYLQIYSSKKLRGKQHPRFEDLAIVNTTGEVNRFYKAIRRSLYHRHIERWLRYFPLEQFHFVSGENLVRDPVEELRKVERFLHIENRLDEGRFFYNKTRGFYCMMSPDGEEKCLAPSKGRAHPNIDPEVLEKLRQFFKPHNRLFYELVGVDFGWQ